MQNRPSVWIDLDNSPHVPFFAPIIRELRNRQVPLLVTARDCFQVTDLVRLLNLDCKKIGRHYGKKTVMKLAGLAIRSASLVPTVLKSNPILAVSHGSRSQLIVASLLRIPNLMMLDYEFVKGWAFIHPSWVMVPEVVSGSSLQIDKERVFQYPGIKEDVYVPRFIPDDSIVRSLDLDQDKIIVSLRPPATEAHYYVAESSQVFNSVVRFLGRQSRVKMIVLSRNMKQANDLRQTWSGLISERKLVIPESVVDGLNLIWHSDLVVSGGGTMNREAAALGVPVYSTFQGRTGAVDRYLSNCGRLTLISSVGEIPEKIALKKWVRPVQPLTSDEPALSSIVNKITAILEALEAKQPISRITAVSVGSR